ncbi:hypothetical protein GCM10027030_29920 [Luteococcus sediminum]|uniref:PH domain-containing protein n=1 Tax=Luteococcus sp. TaxID=1969402 RepID=UPI0037357398
MSGDQTQRGGEVDKFHSRPALMMGVAMSAILCAFAAALWFALGDELRALFTWPQTVTLLVFLGIGVAMMTGLGLSNLQVSREGIRVRNVFFTRTVDWSQLRGIRFGEHDPWAYLVLNPTPEHPEGRELMVLAIQRAEGRGAQARLEELVASIGRHRPAVQE